MGFNALMSPLILSFDENSINYLIVLFKLILQVSSDSDQHVISPYNITTGPNIQVMRIKGMITNEIQYHKCLDV